MTATTNISCVHRTTCRLCNSSDVAIVLPMVPTPVADDYVSSDRVAVPQQAFPLDLYQCGACGHVQLLDVVNPDILFGNYTYTTSVSLGLTEHFRRYAAEMIERGALGDDSLVVEIGSNDGTLLRFFKVQGIRVLGVDAASGIAAQATAAGIPTLPTYFTVDLARQIRRDHGAAALVAANNVFAHVDDLGGVADGIRELLADDGAFVFEVSYLVDIVEKMLFDTVYHEHLCYHSIKPLQRFFRAHGLELFDVQRTASKGGSLRCFVQRSGGPHAMQAVVEERVRLEIDSGLDSPAPFRALHERLQSLKSELLETIDRLLGEGKMIAGYGASATVTTLSHYFDLGSRVEYLVDDNPRKHGMFSPGHHLPVLASDALYERRPDCVVILAWAYAEPILQRHARFTAEGGRFILPMPRLRIVGR
jgi:SAM-dependent methyltransferase